jgi:uncharacterized protein (UPF0335 family)
MEAAMTEVGGIAAERLRSFVQRIERLDEEIKALNADKSDIFKEAKGTGFDVKVLRALIAERRKEPHALQEMQELLDLYRHALDSAEAIGMGNALTRARTSEPVRQVEPSDLCFSEIKALLRSGVLPNQDFRFHGASVYFAACEAKGLVKVGVSQNVAQRLATLEKEQKAPVHLIGTVPGNRAAELGFLRRFEEFRSHGEWFHATNELTAAVEEIVSAGARTEPA